MATTETNDTNSTDPQNAVPTTMKAATRHRYGPPETITLEQIEVPTVDADEVLVEVHAAGVDRGVWHIVTGLPYVARPAFGILRPKQPVPGFDLAGRVVAVGDDVTRFAIGDEVFGIGDGSFAEYATAKEAKLARKPDDLPFAQAAVTPISGNTALEGLTDVGRVEAGQRVLITGASGGVGSFAVQLATALGAEVTGVASAAKADFVRSLGAVDVVDYATEDYLDGTRRYDLILDINGRNSLRRLRRALEPKGTAVLVGGEGGNRVTGGFGRSLRAPLASLFVGQRLTMFVSKEHHDLIDRLAEFIENGSVRPAVGTRYPLERAAEAVADLEAGKATGKSVIIVRDETGV